MTKHIAEQFPLQIEPSDGAQRKRTPEQERAIQFYTEVGKEFFEGIPVVPAEPAERTHHKYGMSKLNYLDGCAGYTGREGTNQAAEDGTRLHEIMDIVIGFIRSPECQGRTAVESLKVVLASSVVSEDEAFYLEYCCKELDFWLAKKPVKILCEENVVIHRPDGSELNHGYFDVAIFLSDENAVIFDWKFGWLPVPPAEGNLQGMGYSTGFLQKYPRLKKVGFVFAQPKLHKTTRCSYSRAQLPEMYKRVRNVIARAENPDKTLRPGMYCDYCIKASDGCSALMNDAAKAVALHEGLPMPATFNGLQINTPEEAARALYVLDRLEVLISQSGLKDRVKEFAKLNGDSIECEIEPGKRVVVELRRRNAARSANSPALIAEALKDVLLPEQVLGACDPKITRLEEIFADALVSQRDAEAAKVLVDADGLAKKFEVDGDPGEAKAIRAAAKAEAKSIRVTRKQACEILASTLSAEGLLSAPSGQVEYLKVRVEKDTKQLTQNQDKNG